MAALAWDSSLATLVHVEVELMKALATSCLNIEAHFAIALRAAGWQ